jgi:hypothetical protein
MVVCGFTVIIAAFTILILWRENKQAEEGKRVNEGLVGFKYTL